jgi:hypothetical protein
MPQPVSDAVPPIPTGPESADANDITVESTLAPDIQFARDLIAGQVRPLAIPSPVAVEDSLKLLPLNGQPPRWLRDAFTLQAHYGGRAVACFQASPSSEVAVLAVGEQAIGELLKSLSDEEAERIVIKYPAPLTDLEAVNDVVAV